MEKRVLTLELAVEQNTKTYERLDRSVAQLAHAMSDLRLQVYQGHASLREEMSANQEKVQNKIAATENELRREMIVGFAEMRKFVEQKFFWLLSAYFSTLVAVLGFLVKYFIDSYVK